MQKKFLYLMTCFVEYHELFCKINIENNFTKQASNCLHINMIQLTLKKCYFVELFLALSRLKF